MASALPTTRDDGRESPRSSRAVSAAAGQAMRVEAAHRALLAESPDRIQPFLKAANRWALVAFEGAGLPTGFHLAAAEICERLACFKDQTEPVLTVAKVVQALRD